MNELTFTRSNFVTGIGVSVFALAAACGGSPEAPKDPVLEGGLFELIPTETRGEYIQNVPEDWIGWELGIKPAVFRVVGHAETVEFEPGMKNMYEADGPVNLDVPRGNSEVMAMGPDGTIYDVIMDPKHRQILGDYYMKNDLNSSAPPERDGEYRIEEDPEELGFSVKAWGDGDDDRYEYHNPDNSSNTRTVGAVAPGSGVWCTGSQIDPRLVLTSFHCFFNSSGNWVNLRYRGAQDGRTWTYGQVNHTWKYWDTGFVNNNCQTNSTSFASCTRYDWAVIVLASVPRRADGWSAGHLGWHYTTSDSTFRSWYQYNRGYPGSSGGPSSGYSSGEMWGRYWGNNNSSLFSYGSFDHSHNGTNRRVRHGMDINGGHSGGPFLTSSAGSGWRITATQSAQNSNCFSGCSQSAPNYAMRLDSWHHQWMSYYRSIY